MSRDLPPDLTMQRRTITVTNGAWERARLMATQRGCSVDDCFEGWGRKADDKTIDQGLGELYELQEGNRP